MSTYIKALNPFQLIPGKRYGLKSHSPTEIVHSSSGVFQEIVGQTPVITDRPGRNTTGFQVNPKYSSFFNASTTTTVNAKNLRIGQKYRVTYKNPIIKPTDATFLYYNYVLKFTDVEILPGVYIPDEKLIDSYTTTVYELPKEAKHGLYKVSSNSSASSTSPTPMNKNIGFKPKTRKHKHKRRHH
jgi:hypothetical protein